MKKFINYFCYNEELEKQKNRKLKYKTIISVVLLGIGGLLIELDINFSGFTYFYIIVVGLFTIYYTCLYIMNKTFDNAISGSTMYGVDENKDIYKVKWEPDITNSTRAGRTLGSMLGQKGEVIGELIGLAATQKSIQNNIGKKNLIDSKLDSLNQEDISIYQYTNIYSVHNKKEYVEFICDILNVKTNECKQKEKVTIYKYYDNMNEFIKLLKEKQTATKSK